MRRLTCVISFLSLSGILWQLLCKKYATSVLSLSITSVTTEMEIKGYIALCVSIFINRVVLFTPFLTKKKLPNVMIYVWILL